MLEKMREFCTLPFAASVGASAPRPPPLLVNHVIDDHLDHHLELWDRHEEFHDLRQHTIHDERSVNVHGSGRRIWDDDIAVAVDESWSEFNVHAPDANTDRVWVPRKRLDIDDPVTPITCRWNR